MNWQDLLLFVPLALGVAGAWIVAWRVSKTGNGVPRVMAPEPGAPARGDAIAGR